MSRTDTCGFARVDGKTALATRTHGRVVLGAVGSAFGRTVRATTYVGCGARTHTHTHTYIHTYIHAHARVTHIAFCISRINETNTQTRG